MRASWVNALACAISGRTAVNLAAFGSAFVLLVAAVRGICNPNNLPR